MIACDEDPQAIGRARRNAELSGVAVDFHVHNAFDLLRSYEAAGRRFDVVVVDPLPCQARSQRRIYATCDDTSDARIQKS